VHWKITSYIQDCFTNKAKRRKAFAVLGVLSVLVISVVALQLMQPAITMSSELICTIPEHTHSDSCYSSQLSCGMEESEEHAHGDACYTSVLACGIDEHSHGGSCYQQKVEETIAPTATAAPTEVVTEAPTTASEEVVTTDAPAEATDETVVETVVPAEETPVTEDPALTEEPEATEESVVTEVPEVSEEPAAELTFAISSEKDQGVMVGEKASWNIASTGVLKLTYTVKNADGEVVVSETELDPAATSFEWSSETAGIYTITLTAADEYSSVSDHATLAVSDGTLVVSLNTDCLYASTTNSPIFRIAHSGGVAPVTYQVTVMQDETELLSLTDYEQKDFTVTVAGQEEASTLTVTVKAVDADGNTAEASTTMRCSGTKTETSSEWESTFSHVKLTGVWPEDLLAIASSQLGYEESSDNFVITEEGFFGYTRYGDWWHLPYSDWCAMYVSFCMDYAELPENALPQESNATRMKKQYQSIGLYASTSDYIPQPGDLIFFDWDRDGKIDHVGIVYSASESQVVTIEGNHDAEVAKHTYSLNDSTIAGYGLINHAYQTMLAETSTETPVEEVTPAPDGETSYYICEKSEHAHDEACYDEEGTLICEAEEHAHTEECAVAPEATEEPIVEPTLYCGLEEHAHGEACYDAEGNLICEVAEHAHTEECAVAPEATEEPIVEPTLYCGLEEHAHDEACYDAEGNLVCEVAEHAHSEECAVAPEATEEPIVEPTFYCGLEEHAHGEACYDAEGNLICEVAEHAHTEECAVAPEATEEPIVEPTFYCGLEEHAHDEACYDADGNLICEVAEHAHTEECAVAPEATEEPIVEPTFYCGMEEHAHGEACYDAEGNLICEVAEHAHTEECLVEVIFYCGLEEHAHTAVCLDENMNIVCGIPEHAHADICTQPQPTHYEYQDQYVFITVDVPEGVTIPFGAELVITPIDQNSDEYSETVDQAKTVTGKKSVEELVYDISFILNGMEVEPIGGSVNIRFQLSENVLNSGDLLPEEFDINVVHMVDENTPELLENTTIIDEDGTVHSVDFSSDSFSTYYVSVNLSGDIDPGTYRGKTFNYNDVRNAFVDDPAYSKYIVHTSPLGIAGSFHLVAFDTVNIKSHTNGNILALNAYAGSNFGTNQVADELSYIINYNEVHSGSAAKANHILVVGSSHTIGLQDNGTALSIDGAKIDRPSTIIKDRDSNNRPFIDLDYVQSQIKSISRNLFDVTSDLPEEVIYQYNWWNPWTPEEVKTGTKSYGADTAVIKSGGWYTSPNGGYYTNPTITISNLDGAAYVEMTPETVKGISRRLDFQGFKSGHDGSLIINVDCSGYSGTIDMPATMLYIDGKQTAASETGEFSNGKIIWNFVNAENTTINTDTMVGSIIAPGATVNIKSNLNGTVIADTINVLAESHRTDFTGTTKPTSVSSAFKKYVDGSAPKATENFIFIKEKWNGSSWEKVDEAVNYGTEFHFADTTYTFNEVGNTYWYRVYEAPIDQQTQLGDNNYVTSTQQYVIKVKVEKKTVKVGHGMYGYTYDEVVVKTSYFRFDTNDAPTIGTDPGPAGEPKVNNKPGKKVGAKDLTFNNITVPKTTPTPTPAPDDTPTPKPTDTPTPSPTPTPNPQGTSTQFSFYKTVNGNPAAGDQKFDFILERLTIDEASGAVTAEQIDRRTNVDENGLATDKFTFYNVAIPHDAEIDTEDEANTYSVWFRVYEYQYTGEGDAAMAEKYDFSKNQYIVRVVVSDDYVFGAKVDSVEYYQVKKTNPDGTLANIMFVGEYDADGALIDYTIDPTLATRIGNTSELIFNNNEKDRNPNPTTIGVELRKQVGGTAVTVDKDDHTFPAFTFMMEELTHREDENGNVTSEWTPFATLNNIPDVNKMVTVDNGDETYSSEQAADYIHTDMSYNFQSDIGVHWYRIYETDAAPVVHTYENGTVTPSNTEYSYDPKHLINSTEQYYVRVEVTMDADYNLHTSATYYAYNNDALAEDGRPVSPNLVANNTEVDTSVMASVTEQVFHNLLQDVPAKAVIDPSVFYKTFDGNTVGEDRNQQFTFIMEEMVGDNWTQIQTTKNTHIDGYGQSNDYGAVKFADLSYNQPGVHWYRISESQEGISKVVLDTTQYIMKVEIFDRCYNVNDEEVPDAIKNGNYYSVDEDGYYRDAEGNRIYASKETFYEVNSGNWYDDEEDTGDSNTGDNTSGETNNSASGNNISATYNFSNLPSSGEYRLIIWTNEINSSSFSNYKSSFNYIGYNGTNITPEYFDNDTVHAIVSTRIDLTSGSNGTVTINYSNANYPITITRVALQFRSGTNVLVDPTSSNATGSGSNTGTGSGTGSSSGSTEDPGSTGTPPSSLPLIIPDSVNGGYTVNPEVLVGYTPPAEGGTPTYPAEQYLDFTKRVFDNTSLSTNDAAEITLTFNKKIQNPSGADKTVDRQFEFELHELGEDGSWTKIQTAKNDLDNLSENGTVSPITFAPLQFYEEGSHWYRVVETQTSMTGYVLDTSVFYVNINVQRNKDTGALEIDREAYRIETVNGVETITVVKTVANNTLKTYTKNDNLGEGQVMFDHARESQGTCKMQLIFRDIQGNFYCTGPIRVSGIGEIWVNRYENGIAYDNMNLTYTANTWYDFTVELQNIPDGASARLVDIQYQTTENGPYYSAKLRNKDGSSTEEIVETTETTYTSLFDPETGYPVMDALSATVDGTNQTFVNKEVEIVYNPVEASLKMLKHVDNKLYTGHAGDFTFKLEKLEINGDTAKWVNTGKTTTNDANGNVIFSGESAGLKFTSSDVGKTYWYRVTEQTGDGNYIYSGEAYIFKVEVMRANGQLIANTTTYNQTGSSLSLTSGALLGEYQPGTTKTATFTVPEEGALINPQGWTLNFGNTVGSATYDVYLDNEYIGDSYIAGAPTAVYMKYTLAPGKHTVKVVLRNIADGSSTNSLSSAYIVFNAGENGELQTLKLTPVYASNANDGSSVITGTTVDESVLTRTEVGGNVFHNTTKTDTPDKTEITLKFKKMMGDNLYSGTEKFNFILYAVNKDGNVATSTTVAQENNVAQNINIGPLKYSTKGGDDIQGGYDTYYYKAVEQQSYPGTNLDARYEFGQDEYLVVVKVTSNDGNMVANAYYYKWPGDGFDPLNLGDPIYTNSSVIGEDGMTTSSGAVPTFNNKSRQNAELPKTGGSGTLLYTAGGLLLMAAALLYWCATRRKRERRYE